MNLDTYASVCDISVHAIVEAKRPASFLKKLILVNELLSNLIHISENIWLSVFASKAVPLFHIKKYWVTCR